MKVNDIINEAPIQLGKSSAKAKDWIQKVYAKYPQTWQNNHVMPLGDEQFAMFELVPSMSKRDAVEVKWFQAYPLRQGIGTRAMRELQAMAKEDGVALTLYPWDKGQVSQAKLTKFYRQQGFKPTAKGAKTMSWSPVEETLIGTLPGKGERFAPQVHGDESPKRSQKPGVLNQKHPFKGRLVGGT